MPANRKQASFEPIPPDLDLRGLVEEHSHFKYVDRINVDSIQEQGLEKFETLVLRHVILGGRPLVIDGFEDKLEPWLFSERWLRDNCGAKAETARDITNKRPLPLTIGHYLNHLQKLADQFWESPVSYKDKSRQRVYLKDIDCPKVWEDTLREQIPQMLFYWNDSVGEVGGPGAVDEMGPGTFGLRTGKGIAVAGDLMSSLPAEMRAENLMCYIGHEGTYTPSHREMCGSLGHNIMVEASSSYDETGKPTKPGSSIWFMTESKDRETVAEYWHSVLGHDIETEDHFAQLAAWQKAPFEVYVVEQFPGDFILIPPLAPHQVWNRGTRTMKVAWNRTTPETLALAFQEALPKARMVCRDEQYKNKAIVYYTLLKYSNLLRLADDLVMRGGQAAYDRIYRSKRVRLLQKTFTKLFDMFKEIMLSEMFQEGTRQQPEYLAFDSNVTCSYCRGNIFNRFLSCGSCADFVTPGTDEPYDVCMECYIMGRSCRCRSKYKWVEQFKWKDLVAHYEEWRQQVAFILQNHPKANEIIPLSLSRERENYARIPLAEICQQQLKLRPWVDIRNPKPMPTEEELEEEENVEVDDEGFAKTKKKHSKDWYQNQKSCHVCLKRHPKWLMAHCTLCERSWCFGSLWRAHEIQPQTILQDPTWECPHCRKVCSTGACRKDPRMKPYEPKHTLPGHDTKKIADVRSTEVLVDFSVSNNSWLRDERSNDPNNQRIQEKRRIAERAKLTENEVPEGEFDVSDNEDEGIEMSPGDGPQIEYDPVESFIDPDLMSPDTGFVYPNGFNAVNNGPSVAHRPNHAEEDGHNQDPTVSQAHSLYPDFDDSTNTEERFVFVTPQDLLLQRDDTAMTGVDSASQQVFAKRKRNDPSDSQLKFIDSKRRKLDDAEAAKRRSKNVNKASKQFQEKDYNRRMEEARRKGRSVIVMGALEGLHKVVKLRIDGVKLAAVWSASRSKSKQTTSMSNGSQMQPNGLAATLLRSDLSPAEPRRSGVSTVAERNPNLFRVQLEDDEDYQARGRTDPDRIDKKKKKASKKYENITVDSDEETEARPTTTPKPHRARRNRDDEGEDFPDELPADFKDGLVRNRKRDREAETSRRKTLPTSLTTRPARPQAMKAPRIRTVRASTGNIDANDEDEVDEDETAHRRTHAILLAQQASALEEEQNRLAKLTAAGILGGELETMIDDLDQELTTTKPNLAISIAKPSATKATVPVAQMQDSVPSRPKTLKPPTPQKVKKLSPGELRAQGLTVQHGMKKSVEKTAVHISDESSSSNDDSNSSENEIPAKPAMKPSVRGLAAGLRGRGTVGRRGRVGRRGG